MVYANTYAPIRAGGPWATPGLTITGGDPGYEVTADLNRRLPGIDLGAPAKAPRPSTRMRGAYELTWDLTGYQLPPEDADSGWYVRVHIYVAGAGLRPYTIDPCPANTALDTARLLKVGRPPLITLTGEGSTHQLVIAEAIIVAAIRGEIRCWSPASHTYDYSDDPDSVLLWREERHGYVLLE